MAKMLKILNILTLTTFVGCGLIRSTSVKVLSGGLSDAARDVQKEADFDYFKKATPANLKFMETLLSMDHGNKAILSSLTKGFVGYGFGVYETAYLDDVFKGNEDESIALQRALSFYSKAVDYGLAYFEDNGVTREGLLKRVLKEKELKAYIEDGFSESDFEAVFFTAQAWGSIINLQRSNMTLMNELPIIKALFDFVCTRKPDFEMGACDVFYGSYEIARPKLLGGNPAKGKKILKDLMNKMPHNLLGHITYLQLVTIPMSDEDEFKKISKVLNKEFRVFNQQLNKGKSFYKPSVHNKDSYLNLFNAIAQERFKIMKKNTKEIF
jgi:hypothetical protein